MKWIKMTWIKMKWIKMKWIKMKWIKMKWIKIAGLAMSVAAVLCSSVGTVPTAQAADQQRPTKVVYLTFDDGPSIYTTRVLSILRSHDATATFFEIGRQIPAFPKAAAAIRRQGSTIGNHTYDHADLTRLSPAAIRREIAGGPTGTVCVRPPYGAVDPQVRRTLSQLGKRVVLWTADTRDWSQPGAPAILRGALLNLHPGSVILMHDGGGDRSQTLAALPKLLDELQGRGYRVAAVPGC